MVGLVSPCLRSRMTLSFLGDVVLPGVNPYDWTERVRRAWRGGALFS
jgi:hypothetical protein